MARETLIHLEDRSVEAKMGVEKLPDDRTLALEELKSLVAERRFVMTSYIQAIAFYIALIGFVGGQYFSDRSQSTKLFFLTFIIVVNTLAWLGAGKYKALAYHAIDRESALAVTSGFQPPFPLVWGYRYALAMGAVVQAGALVELARQVLGNAT